MLTEHLIHVTLINNNQHNFPLSSFVCFYSPQFPRTHKHTNRISILEAFNAMNHFHIHSVIVSSFSICLLIYSNAHVCTPSLALFLSLSLSFCCISCLHYFESIQIDDYLHCKSNTAWSVCMPHSLKLRSVHELCWQRS